MALEIARHRAEQLGVLGLDEEVLRLPAGLAADRAAFLHGVEEAVGDERVVGAGAGIPGVRIDFRDAADDL